MHPSRVVRLFQPVLTTEMETAALDILRSGQLAAGPRIAEFESALSSLIQRPHVVTTSDMTHALALAMRACGVGPDDEVATLAYTCLSSTSAISRVGARPVWVDMDPTTATMDPEDLERALSPRTKAVMLYHVAGYPGPVDAIRELCHHRGIAFIEDCNNALGAYSLGRPVGATADFAVHSFYPNRQINTVEGGALSCRDAATAQRLMRLRRFGIEASRFRDSSGEINPACDIPEVGDSAAMSHFAAALGLGQLAGLAHRLDRTRFVAERLREASHGFARVIAVQPLPSCEPVYWSFLLRVRQRDAALRRLKESGIQVSKLHHRNDDYSGFHAPRRRLPGTDAFTSEVLAVPCGWWLDDADLDHLVRVLEDHFG